MENKIIIADALEGLENIESETVKMCVTSPPYYGLRDYGVAGQIGVEESPEEYIQNLVSVFRDVRRTLTQDGTLWVNIGDSYAGGAGRWEKDKNISSKQASNKGSFGQFENPKRWKHKIIKQKDLIGIPWLLAFALRADGWYLRQDIIWNKPNAMPESVKDRCTKSHEYLFLLSKSNRYYFDNSAIKEASTSRLQIRDRKNEPYNKSLGTGRYRFSPGERTYNEDGMRNKRDVWSIPTKPNREAHFATYPPELIRPCILAGSGKREIVLDPFIGSGTTGIVAMEEERDYIGIELNPEYAEIAKRRINQTAVQMKLC